MAFDGFADFVACEYICEYCAESTEDLAPLDWEELNCPPNCGTCGRPLNCNGLTAEGVKYVLEKVRDWLKRGRSYRLACTPNGPAYYKGSPGGAVVADWVREYLYMPGLPLRDKRTCELFLEWHDTEMRMVG